MNKPVKLPLPVADDPFAKFADYWRTPVPAIDDLPEPERWYMLVRPIGKRVKTKGGLILPDETIDAQDWTHGAAVVIRRGPSVNRGRKYEEIGLTADDAPPVGTIVMFEARSPRRYWFDDELYLMIADDAVHSRVKLSSLDRVSFTKGL